MKRHDLDPISLVFGAVFVWLAGTFLIGERDASDLAPVWFWALPALTLGLVTVLWALRRLLLLGTIGGEAETDGPPRDADADRDDERGEDDGNGGDAEPAAPTAPL